MKEYVVLRMWKETHELLRKKAFKERKSILQTLHDAVVKSKAPKRV